MPRVIAAIDAYLVNPAWCASAAESALLAACVIVYMAYFFGWRTGTASALCARDISLDSVDGITTARVAERVCKGATTR
jgi:hypothetical protein